MNGILRTIYKVMPKKVQDILTYFIITVYAPLCKYGPSYYLYWIMLKYDKIMLRIDHEGHQMRRLRKLLRYSYRKVPYYKEIVDKNNIDIRKIKNFKDLKKLPILTRKDVQKNFDSIISEGLKNSDYIEGFSSGTSGIAVKSILGTKIGVYRAIRYYDLLKAAGIKAADWSLVVPSYTLNGIKDKPYIIDELTRTIRFCGSDNKEEDIKEFLLLIKRNKVKYVRCMPSMMYRVATYALKNDIDINFKVLVSNRETLYGYQRKAIEKVFKCDIVDFYSCTEVVLRAIKFPRSKNFYNDPVFGIIEICDKNGNPSKDNSVGRVIATGLINETMPLIRYELGDTAKCKKIGKGYAIEKIMGRESELIHIGDSVVYPVMLNGVVDHFDKILEAQFLYDTTRLTMRISKKEKFTPKYQKKIVSKLKEIVGNQTKIELELDNSIQKNPSGKFQSVKNFSHKV